VVGRAKKPSAEIKKHDRDFARTWAQEILGQPDQIVIIDTETTGVKANDEVIQIAAIDGNGNVLLDTLINPLTRKRWPKAQAIHNITPQMVKEAPRFDEVYGRLRELIRDRILVFYNANFDAKLLRQTADKAGLPSLQGQAECAMIQYSLFRPEWDDYRQHYRWHKLPSSQHSAVADCRATLALIQEMARSA